MGIKRYSGVSESRAAKTAANIINEQGNICLVISPTFEMAKSMADDLAFFVDREVILISDDGHHLLSFEAENIESQIGREKAIKAIKNNESKVVVMEAMGASKKVPLLKDLINQSIDIKVGDVLDYEGIHEKLYQLGYERENFVYAMGQYSVRGSIIDIFPLGYDYPVRIDLFDDEVEKIRNFDIESQTSKEGIAVVEINRAREFNVTKNLKENVFFWEYFSDGQIIVEEPNRCFDRVKLREEEVKDDFPVLLKHEKVLPEDIEKFTFTEDFIRLYDFENISFITAFGGNVKGAETYESIINIISYQGTPYNGDLKSFKREVSNYLAEGFEIYIVCETEGRAEILRNYIMDEGISGNIAVVMGELSTGMVLHNEKICYITDGDIYGHKKHKKKKKMSKTRSSKDIFEEIEKNDIVVHETHGLGRFLGNSIITVKGEERELLKIKYHGEDVLYVPIDQAGMIQKYAGSENPKLSRLGSGDWENIKRKTKKAIKDMAKELLELSAKRKAEGGFAFSPDGAWQADFDDLFPYQETDDQLRCIAEIKADMEKPEPMDRLLCGDVGFGKTEVASRGIFKCIADGKQAAVLAPTTILANQHFQKLKERFENFPVNIELLSRFRSQKEQEETIEKLKTGEVDIVVGTHRLLSNDVKYKDIGLLVVDEEQKFGVAAKEKIKSLKVGIDLLALSATPIPRTLHMSLIGMKDLSLIEEAPEERIPIQTYVIEEDELLIKEAIRRERERGGQVYIVTNRIKGIQKIASDIADLVPDCKIAVGHGRIKEENLENIMIDFANGETDVLVATTIIESGIDIPNVNTVIILDADKFGLSQLYQIRGRVGRSDRMAYAYLMHKREKVLTEVAEKRLRTIKEFTQFGAGFKIAMKDLEIRGAGNIMGGEQSGHMINVGYDLYCRLVEEAVNEVEVESKGGIAVKKSDEVKIEIDTSASIPQKFVEDEGQRLEIYKRIGRLKTQKERKDLEYELKDQFGKLPPEVENLMTVAIIKYMAREIGILSIKQRANKVLIDYVDGKEQMTLYVDEGNGSKGSLKEVHQIIYVLFEKHRAKEKERKKIF